MSRDRPILFSREMVRAILDGRKFAGKKLYFSAYRRNSKRSLAMRIGKAMEVNAATGCWEWRQGKNLHGYGTITVNGRTVAAHRLAYEVVVGKIPAGKMLCHSWDNPGCINPRHVFVGTQTENMRDCKTKGRLNCSGLKRGQ